MLGTYSQHLVSLLLLLLVLLPMLLAQFDCI